MKFYFAPMEGVTGYCFRNAYHAAFPGMDRFYTPFLSANDSFQFTHREERDVAPENNQGLTVIPQIITNDPEMLVWAMLQMAERGYTEVNLNAGCPSGTVVAKGKGAGLLRDPDRLDEFLESTFTLLEREGFGPGKGLSLSVKTRIGAWSSEEAEELLRIYNRYPLQELIVHPRVQKEMYRSEVHLDVFQMFTEASKHPLVYNGDIRTPADYQRITAQFPSISAVMIGRGLLMSPALVREIRGGPAASMEELKSFHEALLLNYQREMQSERNTLFKMKEFWNWLGQSFDGSERFLKEIRKADSILRHRAAVRNLLAGCPRKESI